MNPTRFLLMGLALGLTFSPGASAQDLRLVAKGSTTATDGQVLRYVTDPVVYNQGLAFVGKDNLKVPVGIYWSDGGDPIPLLRASNPVVASDGSVLYALGRPRSSEPFALFTYDGRGPVTLVSDFRSYGQGPSEVFLQGLGVGGGGTAVFLLRQPSSNYQAVLRYAWGELSVLASTDTTIPGTSEKFATFGNGPSINREGTRIALLGSNGESSASAAYRTAVYLVQDGALTYVAGRGDAVPGGATIQSFLRPPVLGTELVAFEANLKVGSTTTNGIFAWHPSNGQVVAIQLKEQNLPGTNRRVTNLGSAVAQGTQVVYAAALYNASAGVSDWALVRWDWTDQSTTLVWPGGTIGGAVPTGFLTNPNGGFTLRGLAADALSGTDKDNLVTTLPAVSGPRSLYHLFPAYGGLRYQALGWLNDDFYPFLYSLTIGHWLYVEPLSATLDGFFAYRFDRGEWFWTNESWAGWIYSFGQPGGLALFGP